MLLQIWLRAIKASIKSTLISLKCNLLLQSSDLTSRTVENQQREKNISQTTRTGLSEKPPLHTFSSQAFLIRKMQTTFVFKKIPVTTTRGSSRFSPNRGCESTPQLTLSPPVQESNLQVQMVSRPIWDTVVRREGTKQCNKCKEKNKTKTNTLATFSTTSFNQ